uniref:Cytochrome c oxidase subunit 3 n=1 Tax=Hammerschmidtiella sp. ZengetLiu-2016 TaxID=2025463 RepID=A0A3Q8BDF1_9BILA|nr:cytochrome c oxidase subunit 3 [Hammerschmidtiella sp. ZengetLiu-2016]
MVSNSIYPFAVSFFLLSLMSSFLVCFKSGIVMGVFFSCLSLVFVVMLWLKDVCKEGLSGYHNVTVNSGFIAGFLYFVFTEALFFFTIFWVFLDKVFIHGGKWWLGSGVYFDSFGLPLLGTILLVSSSVTVTVAHHNMVSGVSSKKFMVLTIVLGLLFLGLQFMEYKSLGINMSDGFFGSMFFFSTGFHGFHVFLGVVILMLSSLRLFLNHFSKDNHLMFEMSIIYWHFVDVVWLFLYVMIYNWG